MEFMMKYFWPGNVRELQNLVERLVIMADSKAVKMKDLPSYMLTEHEEEVAVRPEPQPEKIFSGFQKKSSFLSGKLLR